MEIKTLLKSIPAEATRVNDFFQKAIADEPVVYFRQPYAAAAVICSAVNVLGFGIRMGAYLITSIIYMKFDTLHHDLLEESANARSSLYFAAMLSAYTFASLFSSNYSLQPPAALPPPVTALPVATSLPPLRAKPPKSAHDVLNVKTYTLQDSLVSVLQSLVSDLENWEIVQINGFCDPYLIRKGQTISDSFDAKDWISIPLPNYNILVRRDDPVFGVWLSDGHLHSSDLPPAPPESLTSSQMDRAPRGAASPAVDRRVELIAQTEAVQGPFRETYLAAVKHHFPRPQDLLFRHTFEQLIHGTREFADIDFTTLESSDLGKACHDLQKCLRDPSPFPDGQAQYTQFVALLRKAATLLMRLPNPQSECQRFVSTLCYLRFAEMKIYGYAKRFIETASGPIEHLSFGSFLAEFSERNTKHQPGGSLPLGLGMESWDRNAQKLKGHLNWYFDSSSDRNVPYRDGTMVWQGRPIKVLRHGTPIFHSESVAAPLWRLLSMNTATSDKPELNPDYLFFIREAAARNENILHLIFENGEVKTHGDESARVELRLGLQSEPNFFPVALRMDGAFFTTHRPTRTREEFRAQLKRELLSGKGYVIPDKVRAGLSESDLERLLFEVEDLYFKKEALPDLSASMVDLVDPCFANLGQQQAYTLLAYAHIVLHLAEKLEIDILEALCKDDIDRGNAFKAVLKLHLLFLTGQIQDRAKLEELLIQTLIPPLIVKRQGIIPGRAKFVSDVFEVIQKAKSPTHVAGDYQIAHGIQDLFPMGFSAKTGSEYWNFLIHLQKKDVWPLPEEKDLISTVAKGAAFTERAGIQHQFERDLGKYPLYLGKEKPTSLVAILDYLNVKGLSEDEAWKVLCSFNQAFTDTTFPRLQALFKNDALGVKVSRDEAPMTQPDAGIFLTAEQGTASLTSVFYCDIVDSAGSFAKVKATATVKDHRIGDAEFSFSICSIRQ